MPRILFVERGVVELAHRQAVGHDGLTVGPSVFDDVRGIQQLVVSDLANSAPPFVREQHLSAEHSLVQARLSQPLNVSPCIVVERFSWSHETLALVECQCELKAHRIVTDDPHGIDGLVEASGNADEPDLRQSLLESATKRDVLEVLRVFTAVLVSLEPVTAHVVGVRRDLPRGGERRADGERRVHAGWLAYSALTIHERHPPTVELKGG